MILTEKAYHDFLLWYEKREGNTLTVMELYLTTETVIQNALIIEWFDSVGIYIDVEFFRKNIKDEPQFVSSTTDEWNGLQPLRVQFNSRQLATKQAIIKANNIYNERNII